MAKLYFYYAAMNAGKSATLLQSAHNYRERGMHTLLFTPKLDDRYGQGKITSRIGLQAEATIFDREYDLFVEIRAQHMQEKISCVLIDEAQFLTKKQVLQLTLVCDQLRVPVLAYGLRTDFRGEPFEGSLDAARRARAERVRVFSLEACSLTGLIRGKLRVLRVEVGETVPFLVSKGGHAVVGGVGQARATSNRRMRAVGASGESTRSRPSPTWLFHSCTPATCSLVHTEPWRM